MANDVPFVAAHLGFEMAEAPPGEPDDKQTRQLLACARKFTVFQPANEVHLS